MNLSQREANIYTVSLGTKKLGINTYIISATLLVQLVSKVAIKEEYCVLTYSTFGQSIELGRGEAGKG